jgi:hypothetical protein
MFLCVELCVVCVCDVLPVIFLGEITVEFFVTSH